MEQRHGRRLRASTTGSPPLRSRVDSLPEAALVRVAALAARLIGVPVAVVHLTGEDVGLPESAVAHVDDAVAALHIDPVALADPRVAAGLGLGFQATVPLRNASGRSLGTLSVHDRTRRPIDQEDREILERVAAVAVEEIDVWLAGQRARDDERALVEHRGQLMDDAAALVAAMREVAAYEDPAAVLPAICRIAMTMTGADSAAIYEIDETDTALVPVVSAGQPWFLERAPLADRSASPVRAFLGGKAILVDDDARPGESPRRNGAPALVFWQPFAAGGQTSAALIGLAWDAPVELSPVRLLAVMDTLAVEALRTVERVDLLRRLENLARTDELTGLPNRRALNEAVARELERARREDRDVCVAILDLDHFKTYNDTRGHPAGDRLLADAAALWRNALRGGTDILGRWGGEEFLVVLPASLDVAIDTVARLRATTPEGQTVSAGVASWDRVETADQLIVRADTALYVAKQSGRDRVECAPPAPSAPPLNGGRHDHALDHVATCRPAHRVPAPTVPPARGTVRQLRGSRACR